MIILGIICLVAFAVLYCIGLPAYPNKQGSPTAVLLSTIALVAGLALIAAGLTE